MRNKARIGMSQKLTVVKTIYDDTYDAAWLQQQ